jgi:SAM-dependent methyltransferase
MWSRRYFCRGRETNESMSDATFKDHFSGTAASYATFRPHYPSALFEFVASLAPGRRVAWDCATGNGQAAVPLAEHFERVIATDASADQIAHATPHPRVEYRVALSDASGIAEGAVDLVTVAQALHWLPLDRFSAEVRRVIAPGGVLAVWCYTRPLLGGGLDELLIDYYSGELGAYWFPERRLVENGYSTLELPFVDLPTPRFDIEVPLTLAQFAGYMRTWSATLKRAAEVGYDPVTAVEARLRREWGDGTQLVRWPVHVRAGVVRLRSE